MEGLDVLTGALARRTPDRLAALLVRYAEPLSRRPAPTTLRELATALWSYETLHHVVLHLDHPRLTVLAAAARVSQARAAGSATAPETPAADAGYQTLFSHSLTFTHLASAPVPFAELHAALDTTRAGAARTAVEAAVDRLRRDALLVVAEPYTAEGEDAALLLPPRLPQLLGRVGSGPLVPAPPAPFPPLPAAPAPGRAAADDGPESRCGGASGTSGPDRDLVADEAQVALTVFLATADRLLHALAERPATLRKAGGLAVREIRRLAEAAGAGVARTRLLLDLTLAAGLTALSRTPAGITAAPTAAYDDWLAAPSAQRAVPLLSAWRDLWHVPGHEPPGVTPTALVRGEDRHAPALRYALLAALAEGTAGPGPRVAVPAARTGRPTPTAPPRGPDDHELARALTATAAWHRPLAFTEEAPDTDRAAACLAEAAYLGLVAHATLTPAGTALLGASGTAEAPPPGGDDLPGVEEAEAALARTLHSLLPQPLDHAHFQSDATATVTGTPAPQLTALLTSVATRETGDAAVTWRFSSTSVRAALTAGHRASSLLDALAAVSATGALPPALTTLITEAARSHGRLRVLPAASPGACRVQCDESSLAAELLVAEGLQVLELRPETSTVLAGSQSPAATLSALRSAGYAPTAADGSGTPLLERPAAHRAPTTAPRAVDRLAQARRLLDREAEARVP
ncbi:helicase-associated domain-containing protein [Streptomyces sp. NPDC059740]|uniref:helicase-associated domain-containing protein n=1 Tax=Streptomyces sp. NPDC059740 TaxID=3346926 RepID=UPI00365B3174